MSAPSRRASLFLSMWLLIIVPPALPVSAGAQVSPATQPRKISAASDIERTVRPQTTGTHLVLGGVTIPMVRASGVSNAAAVQAKLRAGLPALLVPKVTPPPPPPPPRPLIARKVLFYANTQGIKAVLQAYARPSAGALVPAPRGKKGNPSGSGGLTLKSGGTTATCAACKQGGAANFGNWLTEQENAAHDLQFSTLNENRAAMVQSVLASNAPVSWGAASPLMTAAYSPNNALADLLANDPSVWAFSGQFTDYNAGQAAQPCSYPIALPGATPNGNPYVFGSTSPFPSTTLAGSVGLNGPATGPGPGGSTLVPESPICPPLIAALPEGSQPPTPTYMPVTAPTISITIPTHVEFVMGGAYSAEMFMASEIHLQVLDTDGAGNPIADPSDPLGLKFADYPGVAVQKPVQASAAQYSGTCGSPGIATVPCPPGEAFDPSNPVPTWIADSTLAAHLQADLQQLQSPIGPVCQAANAIWQTFNQSYNAQCNAGVSCPPPPQATPFVSAFDDGPFWDNAYNLTPGGSVTYGETNNCLAGGPPLVYPDYETSSNGAQDDTITFTVPLSTQLTVVRFLIYRFPGPYYFSSALIPIVVDPTASVTPRVQPLAIVYEPPGSGSSASYGIAQATGYSLTTQFQLQSSNTEANASNTSWTFGGTYPLSGLVNSISDSITGEGSSSQSQSGKGGSVMLNAQFSYTENSGQTTSNGQGQNNQTNGGSSFSAALTYTATIGPPAALGGPTIVSWQPNTTYCQGEEDLVEPTPPDGNAYLCIPNPTGPPSPSGGAPASACVSGPNPPEFNYRTAVTDQGCWWMAVGSAGLFQSPFWNDLFVLAVTPQIDLWDFAGTPASASVQALPVTGNQGTTQVSAFNLHVCAEGLYAIVITNSLTGAPMTALTPYECASLLTLDPFYINGQHAAQPSWATIGNPPSYTALAGSSQLQNVTAESTSAAQSSGASASSQVVTTSGNPLSLGLTPVASVTFGSTQTNTGAVTYTPLASASSTANLSQTFTAKLSSQSSSVAIHTLLWVDGRFGTVMFPSVQPSGRVTASAAPGCPVFIEGSGLTGTTSVNFGSFPAVFITPNDNVVETWVPSLAGGLPAFSGSVSVTLQVEGISQPVNAGTFTVSSSPCASNPAGGSG